jgi:deoxyribodipyrimidine photo-lyase
MVPALRIHDANGKPLRPDGAHVLYWMVMNRRPRWNHALDRAIEHAEALGKPLLIVETLKLDYPWVCARFHDFIIEGMRANAAAFAGTCVTYLPWIETEPNQQAGVLARLTARACVVVSDEFPCFFLPQMLASFAATLAMKCEVVDANGLLPLRATPKASDRAFDFRRVLQKTLRPHLGQFPQAEPLRGRRLPPLAALPAGIRPADLTLPLSSRPIPQGIGPGVQRGGWQAAEATLADFLAHKLVRYADERSDVEADAASGLSPYLHFGQLSAHQVVAELWAREEWSPERLGTSVAGGKEGWWGMSAGSESFLDELVTWRELGYHFCHHRPDYDQYDTLPAWALKTLEAHAGDPRPHLYTQAQLDAGETHDQLWNAAQRQLVTEGRMHNYFRMLWGKKVIEWSRHPREALATLIELNNRYAVDGRDPNSYSGIMWCFGRFDRPWAPVRPIFGAIRYMSSDNTARKMRVKPYIARYAPGARQTTLF